MKKNRIKIKIKAYEHISVDQSAERIFDAAIRTGAKVSGPIPLPTKKKKITILKGVHKHKDSREQFEIWIHIRLIVVIEPTPETMDALKRLELPSGVGVEIVV